MVDTDLKQGNLGINSQPGHLHPRARADGCDQVQFPRLNAPGGSSGPKF